MDEHEVAVVTGAAGNLGRAVTAAMRAAGLRVVRVDLRGDGLPADDADTLTVRADLTRPDDAARVAAEAEARFGRIDVLCNLAGGFAMGDPVHDTPDAAWDRLFDLNVRSLRLLSHAIVPRMLARGRGRIVNVGALAALKGGAQMGAYAASKAVVIRLTESMSAELKGQGVNVNCVLPSIIDTPENRRAMPDADPSAWVSPDDLAQVILFLSSERARAIHGAAVPVTGLV